MKDTLIPVLLGADLNAYGMARAFFEAYGVPSVAFGRQSLGATRHLRYLSAHVIPDLADPAVCRGILLDFAKENPKKTLLLLACTDAYVRFLAENASILSPPYILSAPPKAALALTEKDVFCRLCAERGIPCPETEVFRGIPSAAELTAAGERLSYPHILKPAQSDLYWRYPFAGMEKVYLVHGRHEEARILSDIYGAGYTGAVLAQRCIGGTRARSYALTLYFDRRGRLTHRACGRALLEEQTPRGKGNYAALVSAPIPRVAGPIADLLASFDYRGFANVDIRRDARGRDYVLEVNLRQGRSNYFLAAAGVDPATLLVEDLVLSRDRAPTDATESVLFRTVPLSVVCRYTAQDRDAILAKTMHRRGRDVSLLVAPYDLRANPLRALYVAEHLRREKQKFRRYAVPMR